MEDKCRINQRNMRIINMVELVGEDVKPKGVVETRIATVHSCVRSQRFTAMTSPGLWGRLEGQA